MKRVQTTLKNRVLSVSPYKRLPLQIHPKNHKPASPEGDTYQTKRIKANSTHPIQHQKDINITPIEHRNPRKLDTTQPQPSSVSSESIIFLTLLGILRLVFDQQCGCRCTSHLPRSFSTVFIIKSTPAVIAHCMLSK
jgi:hypothetical protein